MIHRFFIPLKRGISTELCKLHFVVAFSKYEPFVTGHLGIGTAFPLAGDGLWISGTSGLIWKLNGAGVSIFRFLVHLTCAFNILPPPLFSNPMIFLPSYFLHHLLKEK